MTLFRNILALFIFLFILTPGLVFADTSDLENQVRALTSYIARLQLRSEVLRGQTTIDPLSTQETQEIIKSGVEWLRRAQEESGHFRYEYVPYEGIYRNDDNIVRQAGTFYQIGEIARKDSERVYDLKETMERSIDYFESLSVDSTFNGATFRCIVTPEEGGQVDECKLGATSLALVGALSFVEAYPESRGAYENLIHDYAAYIQTMKKNEGGFRNRFNINNGLQSGKESSFSNGEAMLALVRYYKRYPDEELRTMLEGMFEYIETEVAYDAPLYLWAMAALLDMQELWPNNEYIAYARDYTSWRVDGFLRRKNTQHNMCAYIEGIALAYILLEPHQNADENNTLKKEIDFWLRKTKDLQIGEDDIYRVLTAGGTIELQRLANPETAIGGFLTGENNPAQRVDFTQHCLNAYLIDLVNIRDESLGVDE